MLVVDVVVSVCVLLMGCRHCLLLMCAVVVLCSGFVFVGLLFVGVGYELSFTFVGCGWLLFVCVCDLLLLMRLWFLSVLMVGSSSSLFFVAICFMMLLVCLCCLCCC